MKQIVKAKNMGFCYGVKRAVDLLDKGLKEHERIYAFGPLIHNPQFMNEKKKEGVEVIEKLEQVPNKSVVIARAHGLEKQIIDGLNDKQCDIMNGVCPFVTLVHKKAMELEKYGYQTIIIGEHQHPEVQAAASFVNNPLILEKPEEVEKYKNKIGKKIGIVIQTTQSLENINHIIDELFKLSKEIKIYNTRCTATDERQNAAIEIAENVDAMIVIGGKNSGNTKRLYQLCEQYCQSYHIETKDEISKEQFLGLNKIGITAGASTPDYIINEVVEKIKTF